jgi:hypothetical protein
MCEKYWGSVSALHQVATFLDPSFASLDFVDSAADRTILLADARQSVITMMGENQHQSSEPREQQQSGPLAPQRAKADDPYDLLRKRPSVDLSADQLSSSEKELEEYEKAINSHCGVQVEYEEDMPPGLSCFKTLFKTPT